MGSVDKTKPKLLIPRLPREDEGLPYDVTTIDLKITRDYTGLNFCELLELDFIAFQVLLRDAFIYNKYQTEEGAEHLRDCKALTETEADIKGLRKTFGKG